MRVKLVELSEGLPLRFLLPFVGVIFGMGLYGYSQTCPVGSACGGHDTTINLLNNALRSFGLFFKPPESGAEAIENPWLMIAHWIAPLVTIYVLFKALFSRLQQARQLRQAQNAKGHTIVFGDGEVAKAALPSTGRIIAVGAKPLVAEPQHDMISLNLPAEQLSRAGAAAASQFLIMGEDDTENLSLLSHVAQHAKHDARIALRLSSSGLAARLMSEDKMRATAKGAEISIVDITTVSARNFVLQQDLNEAADLRGLSRAHVAIVGWSDFAKAVVEQTVRFSPYRGLAAPCISVFCENSDRASDEIFARFPAMADSSVVNLAFHSASDLPSEKQICAAEKLAPISTILVCAASENEAARKALALRRETELYGAWQAPLYVHLPSLKSLQDLFANSHMAASDPAQRIIPIGQLESIFGFEASDRKRDALARLFHEAYLSENKGDGPAFKPWAELSQTYRNANRSVADQALLRVKSSGCRLADAAGELRGLWPIEGKRLEALAEQIHRLWMIDRKLDGWRFGKVRDNTKRIHPDLIPYSRLTEGMKDRDRSQIRLQQRVMAGEPNNILPEQVFFIQNGDGKMSASSKCFATIVSPFVTDSQVAAAQRLSAAFTADKVPFRVFVIQSKSGQVSTLPWPAQILHIGTTLQKWVSRHADIIL